MKSVIVLLLAGLLVIDIILFIIRLDNREKLHYVPFGSVILLIIKVFKK